MATQSLAERLVFAAETGESLLPPECALIVLTCTLATPATFVVNHFLQQAMKSRQGEGAVFLSFLNGFDGLASRMKKLAGRFVFVDAFSRLFLPQPTPPNPNVGYLAISLNEHSSWIIQLTQHILKALDNIKVTKPLLFIDGLDFVLAAGDANITANNILTLLANLTERTSRTFISLFADHSLLNSSQETTLTENQSVLLTALVHRAYSVVSLRPLQTGTAKDVTGVIRVTRGGARYDFEGDNQMRRDGNVGEWEALYRVEDGRGKLFNNT